MAPDDLVTLLRQAGCVYAEDEAELLLAEADDPADLAARVGRRLAGEPLEIVLGWAQFCGLRLAVAPGVFVPRRRTELLATAAVAAADDRPTLELCCGVAPVAAVLAGAGHQVWAADIDPVTVAVARGNVPTPDHVLLGDLWSALPDRLRGTFGVIAANAPYVPSPHLPLLPAEARDHEPRIALDGGADGLRWQRPITQSAADWLAPGGTLLIETSRVQESLTVAAFAAAGFTTVIHHDDDREATVISGQLARPWSRE